MSKDRYNFINEKCIGDVRFYKAIRYILSEINDPFNTLTSTSKSYKVLTETDITDFLNKLDENEFEREHEVDCNIIHKDYITQFGLDVRYESEEKGLVLNILIISDIPSRDLKEYPHGIKFMQHIRVTEYFYKFDKIVYNVKKIINSELDLKIFPDEYMIKGTRIPNTWSILRYGSDESDLANLNGIYYLTYIHFLERIKDYSSKELSVVLNKMQHMENKFKYKIITYDTTIRDVIDKLSRYRNDPLIILIRYNSEDVLDLDIRDGNRNVFKLGFKFENIWMLECLFDEIIMHKSFYKLQW